MWHRGVSVLPPRPEWAFLGVDRGSHPLWGSGKAVYAVAMAKPPPVNYSSPENKLEKTFRDCKVHSNAELLVTTRNVTCGFPT